MTWNLRVHQAKGRKPPAWLLLGPLCLIKEMRSTSAGRVNRILTDPHVALFFTFWAPYWTLGYTVVTYSEFLG